MAMEELGEEHSAIEETLGRRRSEVERFCHVMAFYTSTNIFKYYYNQFSKILIIPPHFFLNYITHKISFFMGFSNFTHIYFNGHLGQKSTLGVK